METKITFKETPMQALEQLYNAVKEFLAKDCYGEEEINQQITKLETAFDYCKIYFEPNKWGE